MKQSKSKKQPTRDDLAAAWKIIRDQSQIIRLQAERIHCQKELLAKTKNCRMDGGIRLRESPCCRTAARSLTLIAQTCNTGNE